MGHLRRRHGAGFASKCRAKVVINNERAGAEGNVLQHIRNVDSFFCVWYGVENHSVILFREEVYFCFRNVSKR